eukprot:3893951-Alexandrium_andersonii.AAC.1
MARLPGPGTRYLETFRACAEEAVHRGGAPAAAFVGPPAAAPAPAAQAQPAAAPGDGPPQDDSHLIADLVQRVRVAAVSYTHLTLPTICSV